MRELTNELPKPLIKVAGKSLIDSVIDKISDFGVKNVVVNLCYQGEKLKSHLEERSDVKFDFSWEDEALETGGGVKHALPLLEQRPMFVLNSDPLWTEEGEKPILTRMAEAWNPETMDVLLMFVAKEDTYGNDGTGDYYIENGKPRRRDYAVENSAPYIYGGAQIIKPWMLKDFEENRFGLVKLFDKAQKEGRLACVIHKGKWFHVGTPEAIKIAEEYL